MSKPILEPNQKKQNWQIQGTETSKGIPKSGSRFTEQHFHTDTEPQVEFSEIYKHSRKF